MLGQCDGSVGISAFQQGRWCGWHIQGVLLEELGRHMQLAVLAAFKSPQTRQGVSLAGQGGLSLLRDPGEEDGASREDWWHPSQSACAHSVCVYWDSGHSSTSVARSSSTERTEWTM